MTTLPPNYLRLSSKWLETNPLPFDSHYRTKGYAHWNPYLHSNKVTCEKQREEYEFATRRTDLPREAYADSEPGAEVASERAEEKCPYCGDDPVDCLACIERDRRQANETIATLRAQLDAKEAECRELRESNAVLQSQVDNADVNLEQVRLIEKGKNDKLRAEVEHRAKQRDEFQNLFIEASDGFNQRGEQLARIAAELDAVRKERDALQRFKDWVHTYLDEHGVPHHPPGTHGAEGCRIGDRMDWLMAKRDAAQARCGDLERGLNNIRETFKVVGNIGRIERLIDSLLTPSQQPDKETISNDSSSTEGRAERVANRRGVTMPERGSSENQASPAVTPSRPEPVKAGEWFILDCLSVERCCQSFEEAMHRFHEGFNLPYLKPNGVRESFDVSYARVSEFHRTGKINIPIAPEGKATEGEG